MQFKSILELTIMCLNGLSIIIIVWGVILATIKFIKLEITLKDRSSMVQRISDIKNALGAYVLLGLEILISADIIESILNPTINDILRLAAIVIIRTIISYFLNKEIKSA